MWGSILRKTSFGVMIAAMLALLILSLTPYAGPSLPTAVPDTASFEVHVGGSAGATLTLRAVGVPKGYIASFCTNRICSPGRVSVTLPPSGRRAIELQYIRNDPAAREPRWVTVTAAGRSASLAFSRGAR